MEGASAGGARVESTESQSNAEQHQLTVSQVSGSSLLQCYCPATGEALGRVNPFTVEGIDRAIAKAKEAHVQWAKTSFSERRKVLKTMLKYVCTDPIISGTDQ